MEKTDLEAILETVEQLKDLWLSNSVASSETRMAAAAVCDEIKSAIYARSNVQHHEPRRDSLYETSQKYKKEKD